jgi:hypothetical protein
MVLARFLLRCYFSPRQWLWARREPPFRQALGRNNGRDRVVAQTVLPLLFNWLC